VRDGVLIIASLALFAALEALLYAVHHSRDRRAAELRRRLQAVGKSATLGPDLLKRARIANDPRVAELVAKLPLAAAAEELLDQAGTSWTVARLYLSSLGAFVTGAVLGLVLRLGPAALLAGMVAAAAPAIFLRMTAERRSRLLSEQLPDALDTMARSLRAGHAISSAFQVVASEMPQPIALEFARAYEEQRLGLSADAAVRQISERAPRNGDLQIFAVSVAIQRETGGNLAEILGNIAGTVRERFKFKGKLRALTAEARGSTMVLGALPIGVAALVSIMNPGYLTPLASTPQGRGILVYAVVSWLFGLAWLKKMSNLQY
jgi:tight adherence protein B